MSIVDQWMSEGVPVPQRSTAALACRALRGCGAGRAFADRNGIGQLSLQRLAERNEVGPEREADIAQLDHIDATHAALDVAYEVLHHTQFRRQVFLPHAALTARCPKQFAQPLIFDAMDGFAHGRFRWERSWTLYCRIVYTKIVYLARAMLGVLRARVKGGREGDRGGSPHGASAPKPRGTHRRDQWSVGAELGRAAVGSCLWKEGAYGRL